MCKPLPASAERKARRQSASSRTLPRVLLARRCCIPPPWWPKEVFPSRTWTFSWIFHDGASQPRFSPRSFPADRRTPASSQWHGPASETASSSNFRFYTRFTLTQKNRTSSDVSYVCFSSHTFPWKLYDSFKKKRCRADPLTKLQNCVVLPMWRNIFLIFETLF